MTCIFEFRYTPSNEISFTKSKHNKSLNKNTKIFFGNIYPLPQPLLKDKHILKTGNSLNKNSMILLAIVVKITNWKTSRQNVYRNNKNNNFMTLQ